MRNILSSKSRCEESRVEAVIDYDLRLALSYSRFKVRLGESGCLNADNAAACISIGLMVETVLYLRTSNILSSTFKFSKSELGGYQLIIRLEKLYS